MNVRQIGACSNDTELCSRYLPRIKLSLFARYILQDRLWDTSHFHKVHRLVGPLGRYRRLPFVPLHLAHSKRMLNSSSVILSCLSFSFAKWRHTSFHLGFRNTSL